MAGLLAIIARFKISVPEPTCHNKSNPLDGADECFFSASFFCFSSLLLLRPRCGTRRCRFFWGSLEIGGKEAGRAEELDEEALDGSMLAPFVGGGEIGGEEDEVDDTELVRG